MAEPVKVGIVGLGRWARVLTRAAQKSNTIQIVGAYSRSEEKRAAFEKETGIPAVSDLQSMLANPEIKGCILTVPNEQHLPVAEEVARAGKHVYTEKPIAATLEDGLQIAALAERYGVTVTVGHSARLMAGIREMRRRIDSGELGRVAFIEANFSNERALELTPQTWRWYRHRAPGGPLSQLAIHMFDLCYYLGGEIAQASSTASKLSPVGAEVDDQSMTVLKFKDGKLGYVGSCWTSPGIFSVRVFGSKGLMHYEIDFGVWDTPEKIHESSAFYIQRGKDGYGKREVLAEPVSDMFQAELEMFANSCRTGERSELDAENGNVAVACLYAALSSIEKNGQLVNLDEVYRDARNRVAEKSRNVA
ncbi:Gfo/Idh/MocA family protein [Faunimonas sp. B44]|uniref:Gfo/Idh/MocA family protein n=1 Tax=Faunimonas sp. B44 TaxID=3461493 RepID=UPI004044B3CF